MSDDLILNYIPQRMKQLGYSEWIIRHRDFGLEEFSKISIQAFNELFFIIGEPKDFLVQSDYGLYVQGEGFLSENVHEHRGEIQIINNSDQSSRIQLIQVIIIN